jgi:hypothetical protein
MVRVLVAMIAMLGSLAVPAQAPLFGEPPPCPDCAPPGELPPAFAVEAQWLIGANVRGIAEVQDAILMAVPDGPEFVLAARRFEPISGFLIEGVGVVPDPEAPDSALSYSWTGGGDGAQMTLTVREGKVSATIRTAEKIYSLVETPVGTLFRQLDPDLFPPSLCVHESVDEKALHAKHHHLNWLLEEIDPSWKPGALPARPKYTDQIDVLVLHTPNVLQLPGVDQTQLNLRIAESFDQLNGAVLDSGIVSVRMRNVAASGNLSTEIAYNEQSGLTCPPPPTGPSAALCNHMGHRLFVRNSGFAQALRNSTQADLVVMVVADVSAACGVAYTQRPNCGADQFFGVDEPGCDVGSAYNSFAYAVVSFQCMTQFFTFAHEAGHQLGGEHNEENAPPPEDASFPWSFGHWVSQQAESVMSIRSFFGQCGGCTPQLQFSNPQVGFLSHPATPSGTNDHFNALTVALLSPTVSDFRAPELADLVYRSSFEALPRPAP